LLNNSNIALEDPIFCTIPSSTHTCSSVLAVPFLETSETRSWNSRLPQLHWRRPAKLHWCMALSPLQRMGRRLHFHHPSNFYHLLWYTIAPSTLSSVVGTPPHSLYQIQKDPGHGLGKGHHQHYSSASVLGLFNHWGGSQSKFTQVGCLKA